jgi:uncharacterized SAM-binding protein YcdF (DUF218 family)
MKKIFPIAGAVVLALLAAELLYFHTVLTSPVPLDRAEAVIVFNGSAERIGPGHEAAADYGARYLVFSPASDGTLRGYEKRYARGTAQYLPEPRARTTFENAYFANEIIEDFHLESAILVTSTYHMPRSFLLLKLFLLGDGVRLDPLNVAGRGVDWERWYESGRGRKIVYNEMVKLWGSLAEMALYKIKGRLPERDPKASAVIRKLKSWVLFHV